MVFNTSLTKVKIHTCLGRFFIIWIICVLRLNCLFIDHDLRVMSQVMWHIFVQHGELRLWYQALQHYSSWSGVYVDIYSFPDMFHGRGIYGKYTSIFFILLFLQFNFNEQWFVNWNLGLFTFLLLSSDAHNHVDDYSGTLGVFAKTTQKVHISALVTSP